MQYAWIADYACAKPGASRDYQEDWACERYLVGGKMFGMRSDTRFTFKLAPANGLLARALYPAIGPGYYMNHTHWNSLDLSGDVPEDALREMIDESYALVFQGLTKKVQKEILEHESPAG